MASYSTQVTLETASLASAASLNSNLPCNVGIYSIVLQVDADMISTEMGLSSSGGVYYPAIGTAPPTALVSGTAITNAATAEIEFTFVSGPVVTLLFNTTATEGLTLRNDDPSAISNVCLSAAFAGVA